jgi:hypothetical protein
MVGALAPGDGKDASRSAPVVPYPSVLANGPLHRGHSVKLGKVNYPPMLRRQYHPVEPGKMHETILCRVWRLVDMSTVSCLVELSDLMLMSA